MSAFSHELDVILDYRDTLHLIGFRREAGSVGRPQTSIDVLRYDRPTKMIPMVRQGWGQTKVGGPDARVN